MSDHSRAHDDEIVSAVLDGEATADEQAAVEADPRLQAQLEAFRSVHEAVAAPVDPLDEVTRRRLIDRALDAAEAAPARVPLSGRRTGRSWWQGGLGVGIGSAAAVALLALFGGQALLQATGSDDDAGTGVYADAGDGGESLMVTPAPEAAASDADDGQGYDAADTAGSPGPIWIGSFSSTDEFAEAARDATAIAWSAERSVAPGTPAITDQELLASSGAEDQARASGCSEDAVAELGAAVGDGWMLVEGEVEGHFLLAFVPLGGDGDVIALDRLTCEVLRLD
jgi:hypothetical protein